MVSPSVFGINVFFFKKKKTLNWTHDAKLDNNWNSIYNVIGFSLSFGFNFIYRMVIGLCVARFFFGMIFFW